MMGNFRNYLKKFHEFYEQSWWVVLLICISVLAIWGGYVLFWTTGRMGMGIRSDSVAYIWSARSLAEGLGLGRPDGLGNFKPMTHWPPLYPILLAFFEWIGVGAIDGARWLGVFLYGANIFLVGCCLARMTRSFWFSLAGAVLVLFSPGILETSIMAMTEPLYLTLSLSAFLLLDQFLEKNSKTALILAAFGAGLAFLTRYVGLSVLLTGCAILLFPLKKPWKKRLTDILAFGSISILPMVVWVIRNYLVAGSTTNRNLTFFPIDPTDIELMQQTINGWIAPVSGIFNIGTGKILLALAAVTWLFLFSFKRNSPEHQEKGEAPFLMWMMAGYCALYGVMVFVSRLWFDPAITVFEQRILAPLFVSGLCVLLYLLQWLLGKAQRLHITLAGILIVLYSWSAYTFGILYQNESQLYAQRYYEGGSGYNYAGLTESKLVQELRSLPQDGVVFTNNIEEFYYLTGRESFGYPHDLTLEFAESLNRMIDQNGLILVNFFNNPQLEEMIHTSLPRMRLVYQGEGATIYSSIGE